MKEKANKLLEVHTITEINIRESKYPDTKGDKRSISGPTDRFPFSISVRQKLTKNGKQ